MARHDGRGSPPHFGPSRALPDSCARIMLVLHDGRLTHSYNDLMAATGLARSSIHWSLTQLRHLGLVTWEPGKRGTIRSLCVEVPIG